jgi:tripartite-type tricarboxylate transporter receptor subunit TctC
MFNTIRGRLRLLAATAALAVLPNAMAQPFPANSVTIVVPFSPGGAADILGRAVAERMSKSLQQPVLIDNRPGAGGNIAAQLVAKSAPDGYTVLLAGTTILVLQPLLSSKLTYDAQRDFTGVGMLAFTPMVMVVDAKSPVRTVDDFVKTSKAAPGATNLGSSGNGSAMHVAGALFEAMATIDMLHVPYKGSPPALNALMAGEVQVLFDLVASAKPLIEGGKLRPLAVTSDVRSSALLNVPTLHEAGYKGYDVAVRYALVAPKATPTAVVEALNKATNDALRDPALATQLRALALDVMPGPADAVAAFAARERSRLGHIIAAKKIRLDD